MFNLGISQRSFHIPHLLPLLLFPPHLPVQVELSRPGSRRAGNNTWRSGFCLFKKYLHLVAPDVFSKIQPLRWNQSCVVLIEMKGNMLETSPAHDIVVELWRLVDVPENT